MQIIAPSAGSRSLRNRLDVLVDLDGVGYDFVGSLRSWIHLSTGRPLDTMPDALVWDFFADQWGLSTTEFLAHYAAGVNAGHIFAVGGAFPGFVEALSEIRSAGHRIRIVTNRGCPGADADIVAASTATWLASVGVPYDTLDICSDKTSVAGIDIAVDDHIVNYDALDAAGANPWLLHRPWNAHHNGRRVRDLTEFAARVHDAAT